LAFCQSETRPSSTVTTEPHCLSPLSNLRPDVFCPIPGDSFGLIR
jgi:hypothetical protein